MVTMIVEQEDVVPRDRYPAAVTEWMEMPRGWHLRMFRETVPSLLRARITVIQILNLR
jgi:hypothetical protein